MKGKRKRLFLIFLFSVCVLIPGISKAQEKKGEPSGEPVIGFLMDKIRERWVKDKEYFLEEAEKKLKAKVIVQACEGNDMLQLAQAKIAIGKGAQILVVVPHNLKMAAKIVELAHQNGIKVIAYDRLIRDCDLDIYISFDNFKIGSMQANYLLQKVPKGNYVIIGGAFSDNNALLVHQGQLQVLTPLQKQNQVKIIFDQFGNDWTYEEAKNNMIKAMAKQDKIDAVLAANDVLAGAVIDVLREKGLSGKIPVTGQDADLEALRRIAKGEQAMTILKPLDELARLAAKVAFMMVKKEKINHLINRTINNGFKDVPSILLEPILIDQSNIEKEIIQRGYYTKDQIYQ